MPRCWISYWANQRRGDAAHRGNQSYRAHFAYDQVFALEPLPAYRFLVGLMQRRRERATDRVLHRLGLSSEEDTGRQVREGLSSDDRITREAAVAGLRAHIPQATAAQLLSVYRTTADEEATLTTPIDILKARALSTDPYVRAAALYLLGELNGIDDAIHTQVQQDEHEVVREVVMAIQGETSNGSGCVRRRVV